MKLFFRKIFIITGIFLFLLNCEHKKPAKMEADSLQVDTSQVLNSEQIETSKNAPRWFSHVPEKEGFFIAVGKGESRRPNLARDKAVLHAQRNLQKQLSVKSTNNHGGLQAADENRTQTLSKAFIKKQKQIHKGQKWIVYVLLEMQVEK